MGIFTHTKSFTAYVFSVAAILCGSSACDSGRSTTDSKDWVRESQLMKTTDGKSVVEALRREFPNWVQGDAYYDFHLDHRDAVEGSRVVKVTALHAVPSDSDPEEVKILSSCYLHMQGETVVSSVGITQYEYLLFAPRPSDSNESK